MPSTEHLVKEGGVLLNKWQYDAAEKAHYCKQAVSNTNASGVISEEFNKVRQQLRDQLGNVEGGLNVNDLLKRLSNLELENGQLKSQLQSLESRLSQLESRGSSAPKPVAAAQPKPAPAAAPAPAPAPAKDASNDDDFDLFGEEDEEESEEKKRLTEERVAAYAAKKATKQAIIAKSSVMMDVKPWDDETDMKALEESVRSIEMDGLLWGSSKLVPVAYGLKKLQITCVVEDDKVSTEELDERICAFDDYVQSVDIVAFNKI